MGNPFTQGTPFPPIDPFPESPDHPSTATFDPAAEEQARLDWAKAHSEEIGALMGAVHDASGIREKSMGVFARALGWIITKLAEVEVELLDEWIGFEVKVYQGAVAPLSKGAAFEAKTAMGILLQAMQGQPGPAHNFGSSDMAAVAQEAFNQVVQPFTLMNSGLNPKDVGSGLAAQQYLLEKALGMNLQMWIVEQLGNHVGMGFFKTLTPFLSIIDRSVNPSNIVRHAMNSSLSFFVAAPLTRDLNRRYPIKDLGVTTLCRMFIAGIITEAEYLDQCLDSGLDATKARALVMLTKIHHEPASVARLLTHGLISAHDAKAILLQAGYQDADADAQLYMETHARFFSIQERVGNAAVAAFKHKYITQDRLEEILRLTGFTDDEINLLEIEAEFVKQTTTKDHITYAQIKAMFQANIIGIDDVIAFLEAKDYTADEVINLVLLDFTEAAERAARRNTLQARLRVTAQQDLVAADAAAAKDETALADARRQLAAELQAEADTLGRPLETGGLLALLKL